MVAVKQQSIMATAVLGTTLFASTQADPVNNTSDLLNNPSRQLNEASASNNGESGSEVLKVPSSFKKLNTLDGYHYIIRESSSGASKVTVKYGSPSGDVSCSYPVIVDGDTLSLTAKCGADWIPGWRFGDSCASWLKFIIEVPKDTLEGISAHDGSQVWIEGDVLDHSRATLTTHNGAHMNADLCSAKVNAVDVKTSDGSWLVMGTNAKLSGSMTDGSTLKVAGSSSINDVTVVGRGPHRVKTSSKCSAAEIPSQDSVGAEGLLGVKACGTSGSSSSSDTTDSSDSTNSGSSSSSDTTDSSDSTSSDPTASSNSNADSQDKSSDADTKDNGASSIAGSFTVAFSMVALVAGMVL